jgi:hypothetical protein
METEMKLNIAWSWRALVWLTCPLAGAFLVAGCGDVNELIDDALRDDHHGHGGGRECPDICGAICAGEPEPELPAGCPIPGCACDEIPECPLDFCDRICAGEPEPELPRNCPIPLCACD